MPDVSDIWDDDEDNAQFQQPSTNYPSPPEQPVVQSDFDRWFYAQRDPNVKLAGRPVPTATTLLYRQLNGNLGAFDVVMNLLERAYNAGKASNANRT